MRELVAIVLLAAGSAAAEPRPECTATPPPKVHVEWIGGKRVTVLETPIIICQTVPRPSVAYVANAQPIHYAWEDIQRELMPLILTSVKKAPF